MMSSWSAGTKAMLSPRVDDEAPRVVADEGEIATPANESGLDTLASSRTRPDGNSLKHSNWPHGGRQLSWWDHGRCHRMA